MTSSNVVAVVNDVAHSVVLRVCHALYALFGAHDAWATFALVVVSLLLCADLNWTNVAQSDDSVVELMAAVSGVVAPVLAPLDVEMRQATADYDGLCVAWDGALESTNQ